MCSNQSVKGINDGLYGVNTVCMCEYTVASMSIGMKSIWNISVDRARTVAALRLVGCHSDSAWASNERCVGCGLTDVNTIAAVLTHRYISVGRPMYRPLSSSMDCRMRMS